MSKANISNIDAAEVKLGKAASLLDLALLTIDGDGFFTMPVGSQAEYLTVIRDLVVGAQADADKVRFDGVPAPAPGNG